ncbi:RNA polymerase II transcription factor B subunit 4 [Polychytrium aggregatum]|uniref:RNA polymerase II transcription factor B subunit 4 n=1 Tax=Polychytrium aggregatum TaxID=110093 RepID=UPI0022FF172E|nr:RNA polymerase II transcription factor B subunit 4 [Polychytrium aggregatum]KAI9208871.1 RNA polymerase II transcription factor B subunit 4 [Polychytrium aggregatum]
MDNTQGKPDPPEEPQFLSGRNLLTIVIDTNPYAWLKLSRRATNPVQFTAVLEQILVFINAHLALKYDNLLAVIASHNDHAEFLFPSSLVSVDPSKKPANIYRQFCEADVTITERLRQLAQRSTEPTEPRSDSSMVPAALSMCLAYINRIQKENEYRQVRSRVLIISASPDSSAQYIPLMNCIFSAQKSGILIDVCKLHNESLIFMEQAAQLTGGVFLDVPDPRSLIQYLLFSFLSDVDTRKSLCLPGNKQVDYRAACFCHKNIVDVAYVCSVCLSVFCTSHSECSTCQSKFPAK